MTEFELEKPNRMILDEAWEVAKKAHPRHQEFAAGALYVAITVSEVLSAEQGEALRNNILAVMASLQGSR